MALVAYSPVAKGRIKNDADAGADRAGPRQDRGAGLPALAGAAECRRRYRGPRGSNGCRKISTSSTSSCPTTRCARSPRMGKRQGPAHRFRFRAEMGLRRCASAAMLAAGQGRHRNVDRVRWNRGSSYARASRHRRSRHLSVLALVMFFAEVHPFGSVTAEPIAVDIVSPEEVAQNPKTPEPPAEAETLRRLPTPSTCPAKSAPAAVSRRRHRRSSRQPQPQQQPQPPARPQPAAAAAAAPAAGNRLPLSRSRQPTVAAARLHSRGARSFDQISRDARPAAVCQPQPTNPATVSMPGVERRPTSRPVWSRSFGAISGPARSCRNRSRPPTTIKIKLRVFMTPDGRLAAEPVLIEASASAKGPAADAKRDQCAAGLSALRDVAGGQIRRMEGARSQLHAAGFHRRIASCKRCDLAF